VKDVGTIDVLKILLFILFDKYSLSSRAAEILPSLTFTHVYCLTEGLFSLHISVRLDVLMTLSSNVDD